MIVAAVTCLGAILGFSTILLGRVTPDFLEVLVSTTVTIYGFLIIGLIFVYEQQRRSWPVMWSVRDPERVALLASLTIGLVTGVSSLVLGVSLLALDPAGTSTLWVRIGLDASTVAPLGTMLQRLDWLVAPLSVTSVVAFSHAVRRVLVLLSPRSMSERVVQAARRAALELPTQTMTLDSDDERVQAARGWVDALQRLTMEHLVSRNIEQYEAHVRSLGELARPWTDKGSSPAERFLTSIAIERLITVADRAAGDRDPKVYALECALEVLAHPSAVKRLSHDERIEHAERVALLLDDALDAARPSATVTALLLRLGLLLYPKTSDREGFVADTLRGALPIRRPADVWSAVTRVLSEEVESRRNGFQALEVAVAVSALADRPVPAYDASTAHGIASDGRSHAERVLSLFELLGVASASMQGGVSQSNVRATIRAYAWILLDAEGSEALDKERRRVLLHRFALLWRATGADRQQKLATDLYNIIRRLSPADWTFIRFVAGIEEIRRRQRPQAKPHSRRAELHSRNSRLNEPISAEAVRDAVRMVLITYCDPSNTAEIAEAMREMLARDERHGMMALPTYMLLRERFGALLLALKTDEDLEPYHMIASFIDIGPAATGAKYFNRGLKDCERLCLAEVHETLNMLSGQLRGVVPDVLGDARLRQAQGLFRAFGLAVFALAVSLNDARGLFVIGRFAESVPWFASLPRKDGGMDGWAQDALLRLVNDALWVSTVVVDMPILIAPRRAGVRSDVSVDDGSEESLPGEAYVTLPDGLRALRMRDAWRLAALRKVLHDIKALVSHFAALPHMKGLAELHDELDDAVLLGGKTGTEDDEAVPDHLERLLAEAIVSMRRHSYRSWAKAVETLDWNSLGPAVWAEAKERLVTVSGDALEPSGVLGLIVEMVSNLDGERMPNEARICLAETLKHDLSQIGRVGSEPPLVQQKVGNSLAGALEIVTHRRVYDKRLQAEAVTACVVWMDREQHRAFAKTLSRQLAGRTEQNPLLIALHHALVTHPKLSCWDWKELDPTKNWRNIVRRAQTQSILARLGVGTRVEGQMREIHETFAFVQVDGGTAVLYPSHALWTFVPDLRLLLQRGQPIELVVATQRNLRSSGWEGETELVLSRKALTTDPRPALQAAIKTQTRHDAIFLGQQSGSSEAYVVFTGFAEPVIARLGQAKSATMPEVGSAMRLLVSSVLGNGRVTASLRAQGS